MFLRMLDQLDSPRRHLAFLVGLLVLTFVFTGALAREAHRAELSRQQTAQGVLRDMEASAAEEWGMYLEQFINVSLMNMLGGSSSRLQDASIPLTALAPHMRAESFCPDCSSTGPGALPLYEVPISAHSDGAAPRPTPGVEQSLLAVARTEWMARIHPRLAAALLVVPNGAGELVPLATYMLLDRAGQPLRLIAAEVPLPMLREFMTLTFDLLRLIQPTLADGLSNDSFFIAAASIGGVPLTTATVESSDGQLTGSGPFPGVQLQVSTRPGADRRLLLGSSSTGRLPLLLALLSAIGALIGLAILLIRREAELVRLRADFISGVSHELRTPLAQIRMFTETLLLGRVRSDIERRRSLEIIDQETRRLTHLVENVLLFSKTEGGRGTRLAPEPTPFAVEIRRAVESFAPMCRSGAVEIRTELQENITAPVDRGALRQILVNLIENALKYGPSRQRITVGVALFEDVARVWIDDEGPGIPAAERERVFESFHRLRRDIDARITGSGIGLAVVRELARLHGGHARAEDAPGGGARIVVEFPGAYLRAESSADMAAAS